MMMIWAVDTADEEGVECYLDATPKEKPMWEKLGFRDEVAWPFFNATYRHFPMVNKSEE